MWVCRDRVFLAYSHLIFKLPNTEKAVHVGGKHQMPCLPLRAHSTIHVNEFKCSKPPTLSSHEETAHQMEKKLGKCATAGSEKNHFFSESRAASRGRWYWPSLRREENAQGDNRGIGTSVQVTLTIQGHTKRSCFSLPKSQEAYSHT